MITTPRRSVTRFFIPLIDVLILLFAIFLLMPFVSGPAAEAPDTKSPPKLPENVIELQKQLTQARKDLDEERARIDRMKKAAQTPLADRLSVRVLQIDKDKTGPAFLYYFDPNRQEIRSEPEAKKLIALQRKIALNEGGKEVFFLILYPRDPAGNPLGFPSRPQEDQFRVWFGEVQHKFE